MGSCVEISAYTEKNIISLYLNLKNLSFDVVAFTLAVKISGPYTPMMLYQRSHSTGTLTVTKAKLIKKKTFLWIEQRRNGGLGDLLFKTNLLDWPLKMFPRTSSTVWFINVKIRGQTMRRSARLMKWAALKTIKWPQLEVVFKLAGIQEKMII